MDFFHKFKHRGVNRNKIQTTILRCKNITNALHSRQTPHWNVNLLESNLIFKARTFQVRGLNFALNDMNWDLNKQSVSINNLWAIINEKGAWNQKHHHSNSDLSAAYYVSAHENCGDIVFYDPRPATVYKHPIPKSPNNLNATVNSIKPEAGMLVLFPSYLEHSVNPNMSDKKRIVISFNINLEKK